MTLQTCDRLFELDRRRLATSAERLDHVPAHRGGLKDPGTTLRQLPALAQW
jgi:hypothetical protein